MDFGLGLVLSFTDNATAGINSAVNSLNNLTSVAESASNSMNSLGNVASLSALSVISGQVGNSFTSMGSKIIGTFTQVISKVNETGQTLMYAENQLGKLYEGTGTTGADMIAKISEYAKTSIFDFENLIPVVTMLKANGIEAFDAITSSSGKSSQMLMDYAADLAAFNPQMRNAYGTGIQAAMGALNEYIAEGNKKSLKAGASLDIEAILGEKKGSSIEERSRQVADLMEKLNMVGMTAQLANSPMTKLSNMGDSLFQFLGAIANSGVYDKFNSFIDRIAQTVNGIDDKTFTKLAQNVADALVSIMTPVEWLLDKVMDLADSFIKLVDTNPSLLKFVTIAVALGGALLLLSGIALKGISALSGLCIVMQTFGGSFRAMTKAVLLGIKNLVLSLIPLVLTVGLMYLAWKTDFGNIRTMLTSFVTNTANAFTTAKNAINGNIHDVIATLRTMKNKGDFFSNLTIGFMKIITIVKALKDVWSDNILSEDLFLKAQALGVLPFIEALLQLRYRFKYFKQGFIDGWKEIGIKVQSFLEGMSNSLDGTIFQSLIDGVTKFLEKFTSSNTKDWYELGQSFAKFTAKAIAFAVALKGIDKALGFLSRIGGITFALGGIFNFGGKIASSLSKTFPMITKVLEKGLQIIFKSNVPGVLANLKIIGTVILNSISSILSSIGSAILAFFGGLSAPVIAVIAVALSGIIAFAITHWEEFKEDMMSIWNTLVGELSSIWETIKGAFQVVWNSLKDVFTNIKDSIGGLIDSFKDLFKAIGENESFQTFVNVLSSIGEALMSILVPLFNGAFRLIGDIVRGAVRIIGEALGGIIKIVGGIVRSVIDIFKGVIDIITGIISGDGEKIKNGFKTILMSVWNIVFTILTQVWNFFQSIVFAIVNIIKTVLATIVNVIGGIFRGIFSIIQSIMTLIFNKISNVWGSISSTISNILGIISSDVKAKWDSIANTISDKIQWARDKVHDAIEAIKNFFKFDWKLPDIKLPHFNIQGDFSLNPPSIPKFSVDWYAKGGVFNEPSIIGVGEQGKEAVVPLENNTQWINNLANMLTDRVARVLTHVNNTNAQTPSTNNTNNTDNYMTNNTDNYMTSNTTTNNTTQQGNVDNSVHFEQGSIVINCQNASEEEAERMAKKIIELIKRQRQIDGMMSYA